MYNRNIKLNYFLSKRFSKYVENNKEESSLLIHYDIEIKKFLKDFLIKYGIIIVSCNIYHKNSDLRIYLSYFITKKTEFLSNTLPSTQRKVEFSKKNKTNINSFVNKILTSISFFFTKNVSLMFVITNLNKGFSLQLNQKFKKISLKKLKIQLRVYEKSLFFKECLNIFLVLLEKRNSSKLLAEFISFQLALSKKQNFFFNFLKRISNLFVNSNLSSILGLKILIKGKLNNNERAKHKHFLCGKMPLQTLKTMVNVSKSNSVSYTINGTYGVKVWVYENFKTLN